MALTQLSERVHYLPHDGRRDRPVLGYICGDSFSIAVDAGASPAHVNEFYAGLGAARLPLPEVTVLTHWHWDHTFGLCAVRGRSIADRHTRDRLAAMQRWAWTPEAMEQRLATGEDTSFKNDCFTLEYPDPEQIVIALPDMIYDQSLALEPGGISCRIMHIASPHSEDSTVVWLPQEKLLFLGDTTSPDYFNGGHYDQRKLAALVTFLEQCEFTRCLLGHWEPLSKSDLLNYLHTLLA